MSGNREDLASRQGSDPVGTAGTPEQQVRDVRSRPEVVARLGSRRSPLGIKEIRALTSELRQFDEPRTPLRIAVLRSYTTELLKPYWQFEALLHGFDLHLYEGPYGSLLQEAQTGSGLAAHHPQLVYLMLRWEDLDPRLHQPVSGLGSAAQDDLVRSACTYMIGLAKALRATSSATIVLTLLPRSRESELGIFAPMVPHSDLELFARLKRGIASQLAALPSALFCDLDELALEMGRASLFDQRLWYTSRFPFSVAGAQAVTRTLMSYAASLLLPKIKCIVLDADNTLWGGLVGELGPLGVALGPDFPGSVYSDFQHRLLELQQRGIVLALCSKNNPEDVAELLATNPHQLLREEHFAAISVNWMPKPDNLRAVARELYLGLDSFVFVDDSPHECHAMRQELPAVTVVQTPEDLLELPYCLDGLARLQLTSLTEEDRARTQMYAQARTRQVTAASYSSVDEYLRSLQMEMSVGMDDERHVARIAQLTQKTNQFNLTTRRYTEAQITEFMRDPDWMVAHFSLRDIFGDSGLAGVAVVRRFGQDEAAFDTLLMSCRVIGRRAEQAFVTHLLGKLAGAGVKRVRARFIPTTKNALVADFWPSLGFSRGAEEAGDGVSYLYELHNDLHTWPREAAEIPIRVVEDTMIQAR